ncbi:MAG: PilZ domain-containing protein [Candidatus Omnitrophica bacterium]|nr:PilZ domain-containing protein [Candidatus Omnitrophota bacterium]
MPGSDLSGQPPANASGSCQFFTNISSAVRYFERELADHVSNLSPGVERRNFIRLKTVLPLHFSCLKGREQRIDFFAVVTNLSEGGLFAEFIESVSEDRMKRYLSPLDQQLLDLNIDMVDGQEPLTMRGRLIHGSISDGAIGVEFCNHTSNQTDRISDWVEQHLMAHAPSGGEC